MFKHLKSNGFNIEDLGLTNKRKVKLMISIVMATYILCIEQGLLFSHKRQMKTCAKTQQIYPAISLFRHGCEFFGKQATQISDLLKHLNTIFEKHQKLSKKYPKIQNVQ
jgi:hypothetical protein